MKISDLSEKDLTKFRRLLENLKEDISGIENESISIEDFSWALKILHYDIQFRSSK